MPAHRAAGGCGRATVGQTSGMLDNASMPPSAVIPVLSCPDVRASSDWLFAAFGFLERLAIGEHRIQLSYGSGSLVLAAGPAAPATVMVRVEDAEAHCAHARSAGATIAAEPADEPYGERQYTAVDPDGHTWVFSQTIADVDPTGWLG